METPTVHRAAFPEEKVIGAADRGGMNLSGWGV